MNERAHGSSCRTPQNTNPIFSLSAGKNREFRRVSQGQQGLLHHARFATVHVLQHRVPGPLA